LFLNLDACCVGEVGRDGPFGVWLKVARPVVFVSRISALEVRLYEAAEFVIFRGEKDGNFEWSRSCLMCRSGTGDFLQMVRRVALFFRG
jgi:hypothetical protein